MNERINKIVEETERLYIKWRLSPGMERKIPSLIEEKQFMYEKFAELIVRECANIDFRHKVGMTTDQEFETGCVILEHFGVEMLNE